MEEILKYATEMREFCELEIEKLKSKGLGTDFIDGARQAYLNTENAIKRSIKK